MASVTFSYRSKKDAAFIQARLLYYISGDDKRQSLYAPTKVHVTKEFWADYRQDKNFRDIDRVNEKKSVSDELFALNSHIINAAEATDPTRYTKQWLIDTVLAYYHPPETIQHFPETLLEYWDYYMNLKRWGYVAKDGTVWIGTGKGICSCTY